MDSQDASALPPHFLHHHHHHHHAYPHQHSQPLPPSHPAVLLGPQQHLPNNSYPLPNSNSSVNPGSTAPTNNPFLQQQNPRFPFNNMATAAPSGPKPLDQMQTDGSTSGVGGGAGAFSVEPTRKRRGRPRKYSPDNSIGLGLSPASVSQISSAPVHNDSGGGGGGAPSSDNPAKRNRGRPPGSVKRQLNALGIPGVGFTPHVITVDAGEDVASKIMAFSQQGPRTVCVLSANGAINNVTLRQPATSGGTVTYEGQFEIISLSGSLQLSEDNDNHSRTGGLSVSLAGSEGRVLGGGVAGTLKAASQVQIVVGSFIAEGKKPKSHPSSTTTPGSTTTNMLNFGTGGASPSPGGSSESGEENNENPLNRGSYGGRAPFQNMGPMYSNMGWANNMKMLPQ